VITILKCIGAGLIGLCILLVYIKSLQCNGVLHTQFDVTQASISYISFCLLVFCVVVIIVYDMFGAQYVVDTNL
jgi:hypothetical protein